MKRNEKKYKDIHSLIVGHPRLIPIRSSLYGERERVTYRNQRWVTDDVIVYKHLL